MCIIYNRDIQKYHQGNFFYTSACYLAIAANATEAAIN